MNNHSHNFLLTITYVIMKKKDNQQSTLPPEFIKNCYKTRLVLLLFLTLLMAFSLQAQTDIIDNPDFEDETSEWIIWGGAARVQSNIKSGSYALSAVDNSGANQLITGLTPNTTYLITGWAKSSNGSPINIGVKEHGGNEKNKTVSNTRYRKIYLEFVTGPVSTSARIYIYKPPGGTGIGYADNLSIISSPKFPYKLAWADEFNGTGPVNENDWRSGTGFQRNKELQWYQPENATQEGGNLVIEGRKERFPNPWYDPTSTDWKKSREFVDYTSSIVSTNGKHSWKYGRFEIRAKITNLKGTWPAIWLLGTSCQWPSGGEVDIMENYGGKLLANYVWGSNTRWRGVWNAKNRPVSSFGPNWVDDYHVWTLDWDEDRMSIYVDDILLNTQDLDKTINGTASCPGENPFRKPQYIILNLALGSNGGDPSGIDFPTQYLVDYVRVYQPLFRTDKPPVVNINGPYSSDFLVDEDDDDDDDDECDDDDDDDDDGKICFSSAGSMDPEGSKLSYFWNFGDGNTSTKANPQHGYSKAGIYTVTLTVTDHEGRSESAQTIATAIPPGSVIYYNVVNKTNDLKLKPKDANDDSAIVHTFANDTTQWTQWEKIETDSSYFYFKNRKTGKHFRPIDDAVGSRIKQVPNSATGTFTQWKLVDSGDGYNHIVNRGTDKKIRIISTSNSNPFIELTGDNATGIWTRWKLDIADILVNTSEEEDDDDEEDENSLSYELFNYPNPFSSATTIHFSIPNDEIVDMAIYDVRGQKIRNIVPGIRHKSGKHSYRWDGTDNSGKSVRSRTIYFVKIKAGDYEATSRAIPIK